LVYAQNPPAVPFTLVSREGRRPVATTIANGQELIALDDVASLFQVAVREDTLAGGITVTYRGRTIVLSADQPMASVSGRVVTLPAPPVRSGRRWLVPLEFLPRALAPLLETRVDLRRPSRLLIVGDVACNRRAGKLYLPSGARYFGCRKCHDLTYKSCQEAHQLERLLDDARFRNKYGHLLRSSEEMK
jgi:hypothetical protein